MAAADDLGFWVSPHTTSFCIDFFARQRGPDALPPRPESVPYFHRTCPCDTIFEGGSLYCFQACFVALIDLFGARRDIVAGEYGGRLKWLEAFLFCNSEETRELVASVLGQIAIDMTPDQVHD